MTWPIYAKRNRACSKFLPFFPFVIMDILWSYCPLNTGLLNFVHLMELLPFNNGLLNFVYCNDGKFSDR